MFIQIRLDLFNFVRRIESLGYALEISSGLFRYLIYSLKSLGYTIFENFKSLGNLFS